MISLLYDALFALPASIAAWSFIKMYSEPDGSNITCLVPVFAVVILLAFRYLRSKGRIMIAGMMVTVLLIAVMLLPKGGRLAWLGEHSYLLKYVLVSAIVFVVLILSERWKMIKPVIAAGAVLLLIVLLICNIKPSAAAVTCMFMFAFFTLADMIQKGSKKHLAALTPFLLAVFIPAIILKVPDKPYDWGFVRKSVQFIKSECISLYENLFAYNGWDLQGPVIGFSDRAGVGGDLSGTPRDVMSILPTTPSDPKLYIAGKSFDTFSGRSWDKSDDSNIDEKLFDSIETMSAMIDNVPEEEVSSYIRPAGISIEYKDMHTLCMFTPVKTVVAGVEKDRKVSGGDFVFVDKDSSRKQYKTEYLRVNTNSDEFAELAKAGHEVLPESFEAAKKKIGFDVTASFEDYKKYRDNIYRYDLPKTTLSSRAKEYTDKVLEGASSDHEKLRRLERMFDSFGYTTSPGDLPDKIDGADDFVDYLLFEKKTGYCSYYATAFVIIARAYGIPARYMQGYAVPIKQQTKINVDSLAGHAWPEAYIDGIGWIAFEPTPGLRSASQMEPWKTDEETGTNAFYPPTDMGPSEDESRPSTVITTINEHRSQVVVSIFAGVAFVMIAFAVALFIQKRRYKKMSNEQKALYLCRKSMDRLRRIKLGKLDEETLAEYASRISDKIPDDLTGFIKTYEELLYSKRVVTDAECARMESDHRVLTKSIPLFVIGSNYDKIRRQDSPRKGE